MELNMEQKGLVFNIQRFSIHDGPGIRTVVFLKGCPLKCIWCSNPESQSFSPEMFFSPVKCIGCGKCEESVDACPTDARVRAGKEMTVSEVMREIEKDIKFYRRSDGGVTFSGGEPLMQWEFVKELAKLLKAKGIHTAVETTGFAPWEVFYGAVEDIDLILYDLKAYDPEIHQRYTGADNVLILENARKITESKKVIFRIPVIPGFNDSLSSMEGLAEFIHSCKPDAEVNIIPYHGLGGSKYERLGKNYELMNVLPPSNESLNKIKEIFTSKGLNTEIY